MNINPDFTETTIHKDNLTLEQKLMLIIMALTGEAFEHGLYKADSPTSVILNTASAAPSLMTKDIVRAADTLLTAVNKLYAVHKPIEVEIKYLNK